MNINVLKLQIFKKNKETLYWTGKNEAGTVKSAIAYSKNPKPESNCGHCGYVSCTVAITVLQWVQNRMGINYESKLTMGHFASLDIRWPKT